MSNNINEGIRRNRFRLCSVPGCGSARVRVAAYCGKHEALRRSHGHPKGRDIKRKEYLNELAQVRELLERNQSHPGVVNALRWLTSWLESASEGGAPVAYKQMHRLNMRGVTALDVLIEAAALWLYSRRNPSRLPDDARLTSGMIRAIFRLAPLDRLTCWRSGKTRYDRPTPSEVRDAGQRLRLSLGLLLMNVADHAERRQAQREAERQAAYAPLIT